MSSPGGSPPPSSEKGWRAEDLPELTGRVAVVTGAASGLGRVTATGLARRGAHVVLACRDVERGKWAMDRIVTEAGEEQASVELVELDLADQASVQRAAAQLDATLGRLDILVNNAGVMGTPLRLTTDGFELQMATNHLGHFALTGRLLDLLLATPGARVVTVSSLMHRLGRSPDAEVGPPRTPYERWTAYADSKLANLLFAFELDRRLRASAAEAISVAAHPGLARTNLHTSGTALGGSGLWRRVGRLSGQLGQSPAGGALPLLYAAAAPGVGGGEYFGPAGPGELAGSPAPARASGRARRPEPGRRLWEASEAATGVHYRLAAPPG